jgi:hypothetical protein
VLQNSLQPSQSTTDVACPDVSTRTSLLYFILQNLFTTRSQKNFVFIRPGFAFQLNFVEEAFDYLFATKQNSETSLFSKDEISKIADVPLISSSGRCFFTEISGEAKKLRKT